MTSPEPPAPKRGFVLADVLEPLDFDLSPHGPVGTVPEPSQALIDAWNLETAQLSQEGDLALPPTATQAQIAAAVVARAERSSEMNDRAIAMYARLCGGTSKTVTRGKTKTEVWEGGCPTHAELKAMPFRVAAAFYGWLTREMRPEIEPATTTR